MPIHGTDEVTDVTGAGDTVVAVLAASLAAGAQLPEAAAAATCAAGLSVMKHGAATVTVQELGTAIEEWNARAGGES